MTLLPRNLDYTSRDFASLRKRAFGLIRQTFKEWSDESVADFGNMLVELFCHVGDGIHFYQDKQARETRLTDAVLRVNILKLAYALGYTPKAASAASVAVQVKLDKVPTEDVILPSSFRISPQDRTQDLVYRPVLPVTIPKGTNPPVVLSEFTNSEIAVDGFVSTGSSDQRFTLTSTGFIDGSEVVSASGALFTRVDSLVRSTDTDAHYTLRVDNEDRAVITFGNGVSGRIPVGDISVAYETGGGPAGNVPVNTLTRSTQASVQGVEGGVYKVEVTNPEKATGGAARESAASIKQNAPLAARTDGKRSITQNDYIAYTESLTGVARATAATYEDSISIRPGLVRIYVVPTGLGTATKVLLDRVVRNVTVTKPGPPGTSVEALSAIYAPVTITASVVLEEGAYKPDVRSRIEASLKEYFSATNPDGTVNSKIKFGFEYAKIFKGDSSIPMSDLINIVIDTTGVRKLGDDITDFLLNGIHSDLSLNFFDFPTFKGLILRDDLTGEMF